MRSLFRWGDAVIVQVGGGLGLGEGSDKVKGIKAGVRLLLGCPADLPLHPVCPPPDREDAMP